MGNEVHSGLCRAVILGIGLLGLAGCNSSGSSGPSQTVRTSAETAPTDLQLLCASTAVDQLEIASGNALPVSSAPFGEEAYQVNLTFEEGEATCIIDKEGTVQSVNRV